MESPPQQRGNLFLAATDAHYDPQWSGIYDDNQLPHGGGVLTTCFPGEIWTGYLDHGCILGSHLHVWGDGVVMVVRNEPDGGPRSMLRVIIKLYIFKIMSF